MYSELMCLTLLIFKLLL